MKFVPRQIPVLIQVLGDPGNVFLFVNIPVFSRLFSATIRKSKKKKLKNYPSDDAPTRQNSLLFETTSGTDHWNEIFGSKIIKN